MTPARNPVEPDARDPRLGPDPDAKAVRKREILMFIFLAFVIWPVVAVAVVGGYGFLVWMSQMIMGPPGPPPV